MYRTSAGGKGTSAESFFSGVGEYYQLMPFWEGKLQKEQKKRKEEN